MSATDPRVLFFGTRGAFSGGSGVGRPTPASVPPLAALLAAGIPVAAIVLPADPVRAGAAPNPPIRPIDPRGEAGALPMLAAAPTLLDLAREQAIPAFSLARPGDPESLATLAGFRPDLICVACFPRILPPALLALPRRGCLNLHPSLLPRHRGPAPLFWTFYHDDEVAGVSIHIMDEGVDTGDLLLQARVPIPDRITGPELERACVDAGASLLVAAVRGWNDGSILPRCQPHGDATHAPWPTPRDLELPLDWSARRAGRFIRGVSSWYPLTIPVRGTHGTISLRVREALGVEDEDALPLGHMYEVENGEARVRFRDGVLRVLLLRNPRRFSPGRNSPSA